MNTKGLEGNVFIKLDAKAWERAAKKCENVTAFSRSLGHGDGFYQNVLKRGTVTRTDVLLVKAMYGIDIELKEEEPKPAPIDSEELDALRRKISANNEIARKTFDEITALKAEIKEMNVSLRTIGNLLTQINEKVYKAKI